MDMRMARVYGARVNGATVRLTIHIGAGVVNAASTLIYVYFIHGSMPSLTLTALRFLEYTK